MLEFKVLHRGVKLPKMSGVFLINYPRVQMQRRTLLLVAVIGLVCVVADGEDSAKQKEAPRELAGWGTAVDPDRDCAFFVAHDSLLISIPGSRPHDLAADIKLTNAPRVLQSVRGDFTIQVKVEARVAPGDESTKPGRTGYDGAAIIAMADPQNVVTLARGVLQRRDKEPKTYANFEMRVAGKLQRIGRTGDHPLPETGPVFLRLERRGSTFHGAVSAEGTTWDALESKEVPADWPKELQIGVAAISTSTEEFNPRFSKLQILK
jgi:hypothetical protein